MFYTVSVAKWLQIKRKYHSPSSCVTNEQLPHVMQHQKFDNGLSNTCQMIVTHWQLFTEENMECKCKIYSLFPLKTSDSIRAHLIYHKHTSARKYHFTANCNRISPNNSCSAVLTKTQSWSSWCTILKPVSRDQLERKCEKT